MLFFDGQKHNKYMTFAINSAKKNVPLQIYTKMYTIVNFEASPKRVKMQCKLKFPFKKKTLKRLKIRVYTKLLTCM